MPQMAPMNWLIMFIMFILLYMTCMIMIYFFKKLNYKENPNQVPLFHSKTSNWKW